MVEYLPSICKALGSIPNLGVEVMALILQACQGCICTTWTWGPLTPAPQDSGPHLPASYPVTVSRLCQGKVSSFTVPDPYITLCPCPPLLKETEFNGSLLLLLHQKLLLTSPFFILNFDDSLHLKPKCLTGENGSTFLQSRSTC